MDISLEYGKQHQQKNVVLDHGKRKCLSGSVDSMKLRRSKKYISLEPA